MSDLVEALGTEPTSYVVTPIGVDVNMEPWNAEFVDPDAAVMRAKGLAEQFGPLVRQVTVMASTSKRGVFAVRHFTPDGIVVKDSGWHVWIRDTFMGTLVP